MEFWSVNVWCPTAAWIYHIKYSSEYLCSIWDLRLCLRMWYSPRQNYNVYVMLSHTTEGCITFIITEPEGEVIINMQYIMKGLCNNKFISCWSHALAITHARMHNYDHVHADRIRRCCTVKSKADWKAIAVRLLLFLWLVLGSADIDKLRQMPSGLYSSQAVSDIND